MTKQEKLISRFLSKPKDFSWHELAKLLGGLGYEESCAGKTSGSRARFLHPELPPIILHKPHPKPILKRYQIEDIANLLRQEGLV